MSVLDACDLCLCVSESVPVPTEGFVLNLLNSREDMEREGFFTESLVESYKEKLLY